MTGDDARAGVNGTPQELIELIALIMIENETCARIVLAATEVYNGNRSDE